MPDVLIRDVSAADLARLDDQAARLGLTRSEFLRRRLHQEAQRTATTVTTTDLQRFGALAADLGDDDVMDAAWT